MSQNAGSMVTPAQLGFLAIYNPSLGTTDDTLADQIVYYSDSTSIYGKSKSIHFALPDSELSKNQKNVRLRQIGLAQGMVEFSRSFSEGKSVDTVDTEKSRIILHELESGWWILASVDLTRLPTYNPTSVKNDKTKDEEKIEYSSREVKPSALLLQDLLRAHSTFLLHHASSMSALFVRTKRSKFISLLGRYWDAFLSTWNVMFHGNPAVSMYGGIKLAGSGELGIGVGEEDRGSGEREVLEGFVGRIEGLVDLIVSRFGDADPSLDMDNRSADPPRSPPFPEATKNWLGTGADPSSDDGAIFLGVGALSRKSLRDVTHWMEDVYSWGSNAYGVTDNPTSARRSRRKKATTVSHAAISPSEPLSSPEVQLPVRSASDSLRKVGEGNASGNHTTTSPRRPSFRGHSSAEEATSPKKRSKSKEEARPSLDRRSSTNSSTLSISKGRKISSYFKLGYGTHWTLGSSSLRHIYDSSDQPPDKSPEIVDDNAAETPRAELPTPRAEQIVPPIIRTDSSGHFLVGLLGDIENDELADADDETTADETTVMDLNRDTRTLIRTVTVELEREGDARAEAELSIDLGNTDDSRLYPSKNTGSEHTGTSQTSFESQDRNKTKKLRIVVYVNRPFIFTFLFELRTDALALGGLYRSLHYQLSPLLRPLLNSTKRSLARPELSESATEDTRTPIYDLIWDPKQFTINCTIPNIPDPVHPASRPPPSPWSRIEAIGTHLQILNTFIETRTDRTELERTCKTNRGYWVVWTRLPEPEVSPAPHSRATSRTDSPTPARARVPRLDKEESKNSKKTTRSTDASIATTRSTMEQSVESGPAHPFLEKSSKEKHPLDKEIILIRRASDYVAGRSASSRYVSGASTLGLGGDGGWGSAPAKLAQGIGVDTKRYIEGLLNMNR